MYSGVSTSMTLGDSGGSMVLGVSGGLDDDAGSEPREARNASLKAAVVFLSPDASQREPMKSFLI